MIAVSKKIVVKIGTNSLTSSDGVIDFKSMSHFAQVVSELMKVGKQVILVSSGAATAGASTADNVRLMARKKDMHYKQALCAIGQVELMAQWRKAFGEYGLNIAQLLFTADDFADQHRTLNMRNTIFTLLDEGVVPIVNENDSVTYDEIAIGDNDNLSAETAVLWGADLLILVSDVDGIYESDPKTDPNAKKVDVVENIDEMLNKIKIGPTNEFGTGGIGTKIQAAQKSTKYGINVILSDDINDEGTLFDAH
jgi:glutamate 5-kinase